MRDHGLASPPLPAEGAAESDPPTRVVSRMNRSSAATIAAASAGDAVGAGRNGDSRQRRVSPGFGSCSRGRRLTIATVWRRYTQSVSRALDGFLAATPWPQRAGLGALVALARRPRGARLLKRLAPVDQLSGGLLAMERYEDEAAGRALGWDPSAVVARGRALRRAEGRP
jgi:hypothetical protein